MNWGREVEEGSRGSALAEEEEEEEEEIYICGRGDGHSCIIRDQISNVRRGIRPYVHVLEIYVFWAAQV